MKRFITLALFSMLWLAGCGGGSTTGGIDIDPLNLIRCTNGEILYGSFTGGQCPPRWTEVPDGTPFPELTCFAPGPPGPNEPFFGYRVDADECPAGWVDLDF